MANLFLNLPVPAGDGSGAGVDTSAMGKVRTITVQGAFTASVTIEISNDGGNTWVPLLSTSQPTKKTIKVAAQFMRVSVSNTKQGTPFAPNVDVGSNTNGGRFVNLPATAGDGTGAPVDVSALGTFNTAIVTGDFTGQVQIQISEDGVDWTDCMTFARPDHKSLAMAVQFARVVRSGTKLGLPGSARVDLGAIDDAADAAVGGVASSCYIFRPGSGLNGPVVFDTWAALMSALDTARSNSNGDGCYEIYFDPSIVSPIVIPAGNWDMTRVAWVTAEPLPGNIATPIDISDGVVFTRLREFRGFMLVDFIGAGAAPIADLVDGDIFIIRDGAQLTATGAGFLIDGTTVGGGEVAQFFMDDQSAFGDFAGSVVMTFPTVGSTAAFAMGSSATIFADALSIGAAALLLAVYKSDSAQINSPQSNVAGALLLINENTRRRVITAAAGGVINSNIGELIRADPTGGPVTVNLPAIDPFNTGQEVTVKNVTGLATEITVTPAGADTIDGAATFIITTGFQAATFVSDGAGNWVVA